MNRQHRKWRELSRALRARSEREQAPCALCLGPIDYTLSGRHPDGFTADHIEPVAKGGRVLPGPDGLRPAHLRCNSKRGAGRRTVDASAWGW